MNRFATLVVSIGKKSEGLLPDEIGKAAFNLLSRVTEYLDGKKSGKECESPQEREFQKDKSLAQSFEANEERKLGWTGALDYDEVKQTFISLFPFAYNKAGKFSQKISQVILQKKQEIIRKIRMF